MPGLILAHSRQDAFPLRATAFSGPYKESSSNVEDESGNIRRRRDIKDESTSGEGEQIQVRYPEAKAFNKSAILVE